MPPDPTYRGDDRLLTALAARRPEALALLATAFGRELTAVAYFVLQQADEANLAAASALAAAWTTRGVAAGAPDRECLRRRLLGEVVRSALARHGQSRSVDPGTDSSWAALVRGHGPRTRAAAALRAAGLDDVAIAAALGVATDKVQRLLAGTSETGFATALRDLQARLPVTVNAAHIQRAMAAPPPSRFETRRLVLGAVVSAIVLVGLWGAVRSPGAPAAAEAPSGDPAATQPATVTAAPRPAIGAAEAPRHDAVTAFTLAACDLYPIGSAITFAGWLTAAEIGAEDLAPAGRALYVLVPETFDHADERPACVHDPAASTFNAVTLPTGWVAPVLADGCAASPFGRFAGYVEVGGPAAFLVLDRHESWHARAELSLLVRVVPPPAGGSTIEAWLVPLQGGRRVPVAVDSPPAVDGGRPNVTHYVRVRDANVPFAGCWALNVAIDGSVVGSAVIPVSDPLTALH